MSEQIRIAIHGPGDRVLFWVTKSKAKLIPRGVLGIGLLTGEPQGITPSSDPGLSLDNTVQANERLEVPAQVPFFDQPVTHANLIAAGIDDLEIQCAPQTGNPS